ncbi:unnamed protein product [Mytilus coruscus]|uniref:TIR domain-containing protein n=1 Tax=Mytilus coruscus TaxID=42192 RepID=A0A6J8EZ19_MYTCO|nr:unnamed protein product [Mytilus coruscus]
MTEVDGNFDNFDRLETTSDFHFIDPIYLPTGKDYHMFIAYTCVDSSFALRLDELLQNKGFKCCIYERDFIPGMAVVENIIKCVQRSVKFVFLLSKNSRDNTYVRVEFNIAEQIHMQENGYKPIILKLDKCDLPDYVKHYSYLQTDGPTDKWFGLLLRAINDRTGSNNHFLDFSINEIERFRQLVEKGSEQRHYVRIVVVGEQGAGKSCFVHRLLNKEIKDVVSTDCLDIQINVCGVDLDTEEWCFNNEDYFSGTTRLGQKLKNVKPNTDSEKVLYRRKETSNTDTQTICKVTRADTSYNRKSSAEAISRAENDLYWKESLSQVNDVKPFNRRLACVSFWDFAGHTEYYPTHQLFLSRTCIVLLVTDITKKIGDLSRKNLSGHFMDVLEQPMENVAGYIDYWSSCIHTFGYTCPGSELNPPIIVITTHTDAIQVRIFSRKGRVTVIKKY